MLAEVEKEGTHLRINVTEGRDRDLGNKLNWQSDLVLSDSWRGRVALDA